MALSAFGKAFAAARKAGDKTFEFNGKKYTTQLASEAEQPSVGGKAKPGEYKTRAPYSDRGRTMTEKNAVPRDDYVRSGRKSFDTETENVPPDMSAYKPRRTPEPLTGTDKPGTATRYENEEATAETFKKGGVVAKGWGKARGARAAKVY